MIHPDVELALEELTAEIVGDDGVAFRLPANFEQGHLPMVLITAETPGPDILSTVQAEFEVYHRTRTDAKTVTTVLLSHLADRHHGTSHGFLDRVWVRQPPREIPYQMSGVERFQFVLNIDTRPV